MVTLRVKLEDWAKDRNDFFCIHDILEFFRDTDERALTSTITQMKKNGILTMTDVKQGCARHDRKHSFYIYNKRRAIPTYDDSHIDEQAKPQPEAHEVPKPEREKYIYGKAAKKIYEIMKAYGAFCVHDIAKELGEKPINVSSRINDFIDNGVVTKKQKKDTCKHTNRMHTLYEFNEGNKIRIMERETMRFPTGKTTIDVVSIAKGLGTFCVHDIAKARNTKISNVSSLLTDLTRKGIFEKLPQLADCSQGKQAHTRYKYIWADAKKEEKKTTRKKAKRISRKKPITHEEPKRKATYNLRIEQPMMNIAEMFAKAKWRTETCPCCGKKVTIMEIHE
jgi:DNA-binding MarR family transcriptional regulator